MLFVKSPCMTVGRVKIPRSATERATVCSPKDYLWQVNSTKFVKCVMCEVPPNSYMTAWVHVFILFIPCLNWMNCPNALSLCLVRRRLICRDDSREIFPAGLDVKQRQSHAVFEKKTTTKNSLTLRQRTLNNKTLTLLHKCNQLSEHWCQVLAW